MTNAEMEQQARIIGEEVSRAIRNENKKPSGDGSSLVGNFSSAGTTAFRNLSDGSSNFLNTTEKALGAWRASVSEFGIGMGNDAVTLTTGVMKTRMSMEEWADVISSNKAGFTSLGGTMSESAKVFNKISERFSNTDASDQLAVMGYKTAEYNKLLGITLTNNRALNLTGKDAAAAQDFAINSTIKLAKEMDKVSQLTGISHQEQMSKLEYDKRDMRYQNKLMLMEESGNKVGAAGLQSLGLSAMKTGTDELLKNIVEGGPLTKDSVNKLQLIGGELEEKFRIAAADMENASTEAEATAAKTKFDAVQAQIAERLASEEMRKYGIAGNTEQADTLREMQYKSQNYQLSLKRVMEKSGVSAEEAALVLEKEVKNQQESKTAGGDKIASAALTELAVKSKRRIEDVQVQLATVADAESEVIGAAAIRANTADKVKNVDPVTGKSFSERVAGESVNRTVADLQSGKFISDIPGLIATATGDLTSGLKQVTELFVDFSASLTGPMGEITKKVKKPEMADGSKSLYGGFHSKDFGSGTEVILHGNEAVVPPHKIMEYLADMQAKIPQPNIPEPVTDTQQTSIIPPPDIGNATLDDVHAELMKLNMAMATVGRNTSEMVYTSAKQYKATKELSPNLNV